MLLESLISLLTVKRPRKPAPHGIRVHFAFRCGLAFQRVEERTVENRDVHGLRRLR